LDDEEVSALIRTPQVTNFVSIISQNPEIRKYMTNTQKEIGKTENVIMDGRDIGSVILPHADLKVYLTASPEVRAKRRFEEMQEKEGENLSLTLEDILETIQKRDFQDKTRKEAPLTVADEAVIIDSSGLTIQEVVENISVLLDKILDAKG
jgi:cytidylate kinase